MKQGNIGKYLCQPLDTDDQQFNRMQVQIILFVCPKVKRVTPQNIPIPMYTINFHFVNDAGHITTNSCD